MSLVMAQISYRSRNTLQSASIRAVLPEPTGPPMPTRSGPLGDFAIAPPLGPEQPRILRSMPHGADVDQDCGTPDITERGAGPAPEAPLQAGREPAKNTQAVGLAERYEAHARRYQVGGEGLHERLR